MARGGGFRATKKPPEYATDIVGERGAKSHRGKLSLAQNSIMQMGEIS